MLADLLAYWPPPSNCRGGRSTHTHKLLIIACTWYLEWAIEHTKTVAWKQNSFFNSEKQRLGFLLAETYHH